MTTQTKAAMCFIASFVLGCFGIWNAHGGSCMAAFLLSCFAIRILNGRMK
jgi:hypothetical protein